MKPITKHDYVVNTIGKPSSLAFHEHYAEQAELKFIVHMTCISDKVFTAKTGSFTLGESDLRLILSAISTEHPEYHFTIVPVSGQRGPFGLYCNNFKVSELNYDFVEGRMVSLNIDGSITYKGAA